MGAAAILGKCKLYHSKPNVVTFPELPTVTTWVRFLIGTMYGTSLGLRSETNGLFGALFGLNIITFLPMFWFNSYLDANIDSYKSLNFVGVLNAFALMILIWVLFFTIEHNDEEISLGNAIASVSVENDVTLEDGGVADTTLSQGQMDSEF